TRRGPTPRRRTAPPLRTTGCLNEPESTLPVLAFRLSSAKSARAQVHITANLVQQIQAGSASPSTFAVHLEEYLRPLGCSEFSGGTDYGVYFPSQPLCDAQLRIQACGQSNILDVQHRFCGESPPIANHRFFCSDGCYLDGTD